VIDLATVQQKQAADDARVKEMQAKLEEANRQAAANEHNQQSMQAVYMYQAALANAMAAAKADQDAASQASTGVTDTETILNAALADAKEAQDAATEAQNTATVAVTRAGEAMTNLPAGYKVAAARFTAQDAVSWGGIPAGASDGSSRGGGVSISINWMVINGVANADDIWPAIKRQMSAEAVLRTGSPLLANAFSGT